MFANLFSQLPKRTLLLHFDINRTIIQCDPAGDKTLEDILNNNVASETVGVGDVMSKSFTPVFGPGEGRDEERKGLMEYDDYVEALYPPPMEMTSASVDPLTKQKLWKAVSSDRRRLRNAFCLEGSVGFPLRRFIDVQRQSLLVPGKTDSYWNIVPSFFELMNSLSVANVQFILIFRTFGQDLPAVIAEWKRFVFGDHMIKPLGPVLTAMKDQWKDVQIGSIYRNKDRMYVAWGAQASPPQNPGTVDDLTYLRSLPTHKEAHEVTFGALFEELIQRAMKTNAVLGMVDFYPYWAQHSEHRSAGKVCPVRFPTRKLTATTSSAQDNHKASSSSSSSEECQIIQIFFDDNLFVDDPAGHSIVDFRCSETGMPLEDQELVKQYACCVKPYFAITKQDYFVTETIKHYQQQLNSSTSRK